MDLFVFVGEQSGDLHASHVLKELLDLKISGVTGPNMRLLGIEQILPMEEFQVMGFSDVLKALPKLRKHFNFLLKYVLEKNPKAVLFVDYPGFNLRMAKALRKRGYSGKLIHYISPSVWAWKKNRIKSIAKTLDLLLCILPFEPAYYEKTSLKVLYVGNPTLEEVQHYTYKKRFEGNILSLFPGSRVGEIQRNLPLMLDSVKILQQKDPTYDLYISVANEKAKNEIIKLAPHAKLVTSSETYELMSCTKLAIAKCGTVILELALHHVPTVVVYKLSLLNHLLAKYLFNIRLPFYSLPNIILGKELYPELISDQFTIENTVKKALSLQCIDFNHLKELLHNKSDASKNAAIAIRECLNQG